jgi:hypothetical protein
VVSVINGGFKVLDDRDPGVRDYDEKMVHVETSLPLWSEYLKVSISIQQADQQLSNHSSSLPHHLFRSLAISSIKFSSISHLPITNMRSQLALLTIAVASVSAIPQSQISKRDIVSDENGNIKITCALYPPSYHSYH